MELSAQDELVLAGLLAAVAVLLVLAAATRIPYPILLVVGGLGLGFVPGVPTLELPPELVLVAFLPPLLYSAAFFTSLRDLRANARPISLLAIGLVVATTVAVGVVAHETIPGLPWSAAFVLGAIVSPTDPIAATAIARRFGVPPQVVTVVEGESLINDGTALVLYRVAVAAVVSGTFSLWEAGLRFVLTAAGGIAVGLLVGMVVAEVRRRLDNPPVEITISLMSGYLGYLPAEAIGVSGVLAAVTVGIYVGRLAPQLTTVQLRLQGIAAWEILVFVANSLLFVLVGLQLPTIVDQLSGRATGTIALATVLVCATVILTRVFWVFPFMYVPKLFARRYRDSRPQWKPAALVSWMGMRGAVALAAALALPFETDAGAPFPERDLIVFITFCVILVTLVVQGLTLPALIRLLGVPSDAREEKEEIKARIHAVDAALVRLEELVDEHWVREDTAERLRGLYGFRRGRFAARFDESDEGEIERRSLDFQRLRRELLDAERAAVVGLRNEGRINDEVMRRVVRDLDLEDARLEI